ncbi:hypothetical protein [Mucilaginibacter glaciei]|uniref:Uncharacterized protein n=1 Tax=Mucilaginibacter glaciei TaxID=2772109 RepID=A0A926S4M9_9SPHI|nr:hypothetical protein [Mucilaginibacter glaciei]MBD1395439.1 hypothetical protein [Mucilaginibacter glaciei]
MLINTRADANGTGSIQSVSNSNNSHVGLLLDTSGGNVGVDKSFPTAKFHVLGTGNNLDDYTPLAAQSLVIEASKGGRNTNIGAQLEFAIPCNTDGKSLWGQGRIMTVAAYTGNNNASGKMVMGTRRNFNKLGTGYQWYYGNDLTIDGDGKMGIGKLTQPQQLMLVRSSIMENCKPCLGDSQKVIRPGKEHFWV